MNENFILRVVNPSSEILEIEVNSVTLKGEDGEFGILALHADFTSVVREGMLVVGSSGEEQRFFTGGGVIEITDNICTLITEEFCRFSELSQETAEARLKDAEQILSATGGDKQLAAREQRIAKSILQAISKGKIEIK
jgi:F-type H+-transporting ATPase subunit epsilon